MEIAIEGILLSAAAIAVYLIGGVYCFIWSRAQAQSRAATWPPEAQGRSLQAELDAMREAMDALNVQLEAQRVVAQSQALLQQDTPPAWMLENLAGPTTAGPGGAVGGPRMLYAVGSTLSPATNAASAARAAAA